MKIEVGNMWSVKDEADLFLFTSNGVVNRGMLAMGGGFAKQMLTHVGSGIAKGIGASLKRDYERVGGVYRYGLLVSKNWPNVKWGAFQTKLHYRDRTPLDLVAESTQDLLVWATEHPDAQIHCNFPAVGLGGRTYREILPIIQILPDNVHFWTQDAWFDRPHYKSSSMWFVRKVMQITNNEDPDQFLVHPDQPYEPDPYYWRLEERRGLFTHMFGPGSEELVLAHVDSYPYKQKPEILLYKVVDDKILVSIVSEDDLWLVKHLVRTSDGWIWMPPPKEYQTKRDCLRIFPRHEEFEHGI